MLKLVNLGKTFQNKEKLKVFRHLTVSIRNGEFVAIFGPNGCGKSTLLNAIAGLIDLDEGNILFNNKAVNKLNIGFIFQDYKNSLFPWLTAKDNIASPLRFRNTPKFKTDKLVKDIYKKYDCNFILDAYPYELSDGQQQLVAVLRSIIIKPDIFLLDEPFSSLDYQTTLLLLEKLSMIWYKMKITTLFVSHDIDDAIFLAQKIILLSSKPARIIKIFSVEKSYPRNLSFIGTKQFNRLKRNILKLYSKEIGSE